MFTLTFCLCSLFMDRSRSNSAQINALVDQLGSPVHSERVAAAKSLDAIGEPALEALREAAKANEDAEVRRRAERLVYALELRQDETEAKAIRESKLPPEEKGQKLRMYLELGVGSVQIHRILGTSFEGNARQEYYADYALVVSYDRYGNVTHIEHPERARQRKRHEQLRGLR